MRAQRKVVLFFASDVESFGENLGTLPASATVQRLGWRGLTIPAWSSASADGFGRTGDRVSGRPTARGSSIRLHPPMQIDESPIAIDLLACATASSPDPHKRLVVDRAPRSANCEQSRHSPYVAILFTGAIAVSDDHVIDLLRINIRLAAEQLGHCSRCEVVGPHQRETTTDLADRSPDSVEYEYRFTEFLSGYTDSHLDRQYVLGRVRPPCLRLLRDVRSLDI